MALEAVEPWARALAEEANVTCNKICEGDGSGMVGMPWFGRDENEWHKVIRIPLYLIGLGWLFLGVAVVADVFMGAIEHITSQRKRVYDPKQKKDVTVMVWNATVANLTLLALGSSAPEILLACIEILSADFYSGDLGPSTIVGSAAFNLLVIIAVCIMAIPDDDLRRIKEMPVYITTAIWSLVAYLWLLVILMGTSENVVEPWEGVLTLLFMPLLVINAFMADKGYFGDYSGESGDEYSLEMVGADMTKEDLAALTAKIRGIYGEELTETQVAKIIAIEHSKQPGSRAQRRVDAIRKLTGGKRVQAEQKSIVDVIGEEKHSEMVAAGTMPQRHANTKSSQVVPEGGAVIGKPTLEVPDKSAEIKEICLMEFAVLSMAVLENQGKRQVQVTRKGHIDKKATVAYKTREGTAKPGADYEHVEGVLTFDAGVTSQFFAVSIVDDNAFESDEEFYVDLADPQVEGVPGAGELGQATVTIVIIEDDLPGVVSFAEEQMTFKEPSSGDQVIDITVLRQKGATGAISLRAYTQDDTAKAGVDYEGLDETIEFEDGQKATTISLTIKERTTYERCEMFRLILEDLEGGATFDPKTDGGAESCILTVFVESAGQEAKARVDRIMQKLARKWEKSRIGHTNWKDQFLDALYVNGAPKDDARTPLVDEPGSPKSQPSSLTSSTMEFVETPSATDYAMHIVSLPWKLLFALVPPVDYCGGWICFFCSLIMIAGVTALIGDMAALLGCTLGIPNEVTAITFVALGTSLPDTFASMSSAKDDPTADASIGNVTGSNSVNVFLGLGLPWTMASIYWMTMSKDSDTYKGWSAKYASDFANGVIDKKWMDGVFVVKAGTLGFSVAIFSCCAIAAIAMLYVRRRTIGGELGGPKYNKIFSASFLLLLWAIYVVCSSVYALSESPCV
jgi:solute carrier family 8 (sodium/calcium exchanger)